MTKKLFCFGFGYTAQRLAGALIEQGFHIAGTTRDHDRRDELREMGVEAYVFDRHHPLNNVEAALKDVTHILVSTPSDGEGDPTATMHGADLSYVPTLEWVGYLSATSVYGNRDGDWVDEEAEINPGSIRGSRRALAEKQWQELWYREAVPLHIFRLAGIYGPGRSAIETVRAGYAKRVDKDGQVFSRIHVDDIVQTLIASINKPNPGEIYNVSDDLPATSHEVIEYACELLGIEPPALMSWEEADLSPMAASFYKENKRVRNTKIKEALGVALKHPTYRDGLKAILEEQGVKPLSPKDL